MTSLPTYDEPAHYYDEPTIGMDQLRHILVLHLMLKKLSGLEKNDEPTRLSPTCKHGT